jgi:signal transduction histidine kinase
MPNVVEADQALLHQAVYNLLENAIKYTPDKGRVTIRTSSQPGFLIWCQIMHTLATVICILR